MKTDTLKKSLLDYAIKGRLTAKFRRENSELSAFDELEIYNDKIKQKRKNLEKELKTLEFKLKKASTRHCETSAGSRGKTSEAVQGVAEAGFFSNPQTKQELKSQIQMLKKELTKCKEITPLNFSEVPFEIPNSWAWVKLGDICEIFTGATPKTSNAENFGDFIPFLNPGDIDNNGNVIYSNRGLTEKGLKEARKIEANSILVVCIGGLIGKACLVDRECTCNQQINVAKPFFAEAILLYYFINSAYFQSTIKANSTGTATPIINKNLFEQILIPLPPLKEQQEIVKKLDLLVSLANDFAITKENLKRIEKRIEKSLLKLALEGSLSKLYRRSSPTLSAFNEISTYNEAIKEKRKDLEKKLKICEKELKLEKDKDKKALFKSQIQILKKEIAKCKEITPLNLSEAPFEIPNTWAWVKLGDICEMKKGPFGSAITKDMFIPNGNNAVKIYEQKNAIQKSETLGEYYISLEHFEKLKQFEVFENDIIVSCAGTIGEIFRIPKNAPKGIINQALMKIKLVNEEWIPYFMIFFDFLIKQKSQENSKGSAIKNIPPLDILKNFSIPLPPLKEQEHITQILDTLFTLKKGLRVD
ncbi:restriction endonuclease subunit S [Campylobacter upsaliensis]|nr:restriction endonuclease subunit S [Campylobacter upsaliensis]